MDKKNKDEIIKNQADLINNAQELLGSLLGRMQASASLGLSYGADNNDRDLYEVLGYRRTLLFKHYYDSFKRDGIAKRLINKLPNAVWKSNPVIVEVDKKDNKETEFEKQYRFLQKKLKINNKMCRLDKLTSFGRYGIMLIGFNDSDDFKMPVAYRRTKLVCNYIHPYSQNSCDIIKFDDNPQSERYGLPEYYSITVGSLNYLDSDNIGSVSKTIEVHHSRVIHVAKNIIESDIYGDPELEDVYNYLQNIEKIAGGSAEMFWRGARPGYVATAQKDVNIDTISASAMQDQMDEFDHNLRRWLKLQGVDVKALETQVVSPIDHIDAQLELICIAKGIPKRVLLGSERGELASGQDLNTWNELVFQNMENHAEPNMLRPLVDKFIEYGILPSPASEEYDVVWPELSVISDKEKAEINLNKVKTLGEYVKSPGADMIVPEEVFLEKFLDFSKEELVQLTNFINENEEELLEEINNPMEINPQNEDEI